MKCKQEEGLALGNVNGWINWLDFFPSHRCQQQQHQLISTKRNYLTSGFVCLFVSVTKDFQPWGLEPEFLQIMRSVSAFHFTNNVILIVHMCIFMEIY